MFVSKTESNFNYLVENSVCPQRNSKMMYVFAQNMMFTLGDTKSRFPILAMIWNNKYLF